MRILARSARGTEHLVSRQAFAGIDPEDFPPILSSSHSSTFILYAVAVGAIVFAIVLVIILVLVLKLRKRRHARAMEAEIMTLLHREQASRQTIMVEKKQDTNAGALPARPEMARVRPFSTALYENGNVPEVAFDDVAASRTSTERQLFTNDVMDRMIRSRATRSPPQTYSSPAPEYSPYGPADENAHRDISIRVPPSPPLDPCEYEWELLHGGQAQPFPAADETSAMLLSEGFPKPGGTSLAGPTLVLSEDGGHCAPIAGISIIKTGSNHTLGRLASDRRSTHSSISGTHSLGDTDVLSPTLSMLLVLESPRGAKYSGVAEADQGSAHAWLVDDDWLYDSSVIALDADGPEEL